MVDLYLDIIAWFPNNGLIVVEQTFVGERVILAEGEFSSQQEPRNTGGTYARFPNKNQEIQGEPMPDFQTKEPQKSMDNGQDKISRQRK